MKRHIKLVIINQYQWAARGGGKISMIDLFVDWISFCRCFKIVAGIVFFGIGLSIVIETISIPSLEPR